MTASRAGFDAFRRYYADPAGSLATDRFEQREQLFRLRWQYYTNEALEDPVLWSVYKRTYRLYRGSKALFNPTRRLVDLYAGMIYPGFVAPDNDEMKPGLRNALPLPDGTDPQLRTAIAQVCRWSNWQSRKGLYVRYGAALGSCLGEIIDDVERQKVYMQLTWPGFVSDLRLDAQGNVQMYELTYEATERIEGTDTDDTYTFTKYVDANTIRYEVDGNTISEFGNPYGFVPAVWLRHTDMGDDLGAPALRAQSKMDALNSLASHAVDNIHKTMAAPILVTGSGTVSPLFADTTKRPGQETETPLDAEALDILKGPADAGFVSMNVPTGDALTMMERLLAEIQADHPELTFYEEMRSMQSVTGPAASRLMGDVEAPIMEAQANYDMQLTKMLQMAVAIGGWRLSGGAWPDGTQQQRNLAGFDLNSYGRGDLDFTIEPRPIFPLTAQEELELERQQWDFEQQKQQPPDGQVENAVRTRLRDAGNGARNA